MNEENLHSDLMLKTLSNEKWIAFGEIINMLLCRSINNVDRQCKEFYWSESFVAVEINFQWVFWFKSNVRDRTAVFCLANNNISKEYQNRTMLFKAEQLLVLIRIWSEFFFVKINCAFGRWLFSLKICDIWHDFCYKLGYQIEVNHFLLSTAEPGRVLVTIPHPFSIFSFGKLLISLLSLHMFA